MNRGEEFEIKCFEYLRRKYPTKEFERKGGMDSTVPDIAVMKNGKIEYYIEVKDPKAQSGQFVLLPNDSTRTFVFSPKNKSEQNEMTDIIIGYINSDYDRFNNAGTAGEQIDIDETVFLKWIVDHNRDRLVKYYMSFYNGYVVFPIRKFADYFDVSAKFRIKKSGSSDTPQKKKETVKNTIKNHYNSAVFSDDGKALVVELNEKVDVDRFSIGDYTYYLSIMDNGKYRVRQLSNTYNMNVIFAISLKKKQDPADLKEFEMDL